MILMIIILINKWSHFRPIRMEPPAARSTQSCSKPQCRHLLYRNQRVESLLKSKRKSKVTRLMIMLCTVSQLTQRRSQRRSTRKRNQSHNQLLQAPQLEPKQLILMLMMTQKQLRPSRRRMRMIRPLMWHAFWEERQTIRTTSQIPSQLIQKRWQPN